jgi:hypothetical protein
MGMKVTNNATTTLTAPALLAGDLALNVAGATGALFPALGAGDYFYCTLSNLAGAIEIIKVTARTADAFTIVRGQDGTTALGWAIGDKVELRLVAAIFNDLPKLDEANSYSKQQTYTLAIGTAPFVVTSTTPVANLAIGGNSGGLAGGAAGSLPYQSAAGVTAMLANGTAGQYLMSNGGGAAPTWGSIAAGVTSVNGNTGAVTAAQVSAAATTGYGYTPVAPSTLSGYAANGGGMSNMVAIPAGNVLGAILTGVGATPLTINAGYAGSGTSISWVTVGLSISGTWRCLAVSPGISDGNMVLQYHHTFQRIA